MATAGMVDVVDWTARYDELTTRRDALTAEELDALGLAAWFLGRETECERVWGAAHLAYLDAGETDAAIHCVFWVGFILIDRGDMVRAGAWMSRLMQLCAIGDRTPEREPTAMLARAALAFGGGRFDEAAELCERAIALARESRDTDVEVLATMNLARSLVYGGHVDEGFDAMDRVMLAISSGRVSDRAAGPAYCAVIASCLERSLDARTLGPSGAAGGAVGVAALMRCSAYF